MSLPACTNRTEGTWEVRVKHKLKKMRGINKHLLPSYLDEYLWRSWYFDGTLDPSEYFEWLVLPACTNRIEGTWEVRVKHKLKKMRGINKHLLPSYLDEYLWRSWYFDGTLDPSEYFEWLVPFFAMCDTSDLVKVFQGANEPTRCTNRIEGTWEVRVKHKLKKMRGINKHLLPSYLDEVLVALLVLRRHPGPVRVL
ncbi:hypothetical protein PInf_024457 [Phytophthora infestans]|nr:hypothetical protein PInf_024457 [Phytophthora infestans]